MNILVADSDQGIRNALRRVLEQATDCVVTEVDNGLDLLEQLEVQRFDLVILDLVMPGLDGLEVLQIIRSSDGLRDLPVIVVTAVKDERGVADVIRLGITDYVTKPLRPDRLATRLGHVLQTTLGGVMNERRLHSSLTPGKSIMIVDANAEFRGFFASVMAVRNPVIEAASGAIALKLCQQEPPAAVFIGPDTGTLSPEALVRKLRATTGVSMTSVLGAWPKGRLDAARDSGLFDEVIARTFVPDVLKGQLEEVYTRSTATDGGRDVSATAETVLRQLEPRTRSTIEQVFGMMLATDLVSSLTPPPSGPAVVSSVDISQGSGHPLVFRMVMPVDHARQFAARLLLIDEASTDDAMSGMKEVANVIVGRIQKTLVDAGTSVTCGAPQVRLADVPPRFTETTPTRIVQFFETEHGEPLFGVELDGTAA
ncbi:MAG: response regulator [Acidobacteria bacterium]|nr:response regulator [Acidobacteriota bacterium]